MIDPGEILIWISLFLSIVSSVLLVLNLTGRKNLDTVAELAIYGYTLALTISFFLLLRYFVIRDFNVEYVFEYSDSNLSPIYTISAVWAGREGSLLMWAMFMGLFNSVIVATAKRDSVTKLSLVILSLLILFFSAIMLTEYSNPFIRMDFTPIEGYGLNPLLRTPEMAIHPPTIFVGYAGLAIPFAFAVAGLIYREEWVKRARKYLIFSWMFLSFGILLGAWWAYKTLGWGGYWAWDPVENASLLPWFTASALIHGAIVEERRKSFKNLNYFMALITFDLIILAAFITRSGIISSVHAFGENPIGYAYLGLIAASTIFALLAWILRMDHAGEIEFKWKSREALILINILILSLSTLLVLAGTITPMFNEEITLNREYYDSIEIPMGTALVVLLGLCAALNWVADSERFKKNGVVALVAGLAVGIAVFGLTRLGVASLGAGIFVFALLLQSMGLKLKDLSNRRKFGGYLVHIGIILVFIGTMGSWIYDTTYTNVGLKVGDRINLDPTHEVEFTDLRAFEDPEKYTIIATINLYENGEYQGTLQPKEYWYKLDRQDRVVHSVEIISQLDRDLYVAMGGTTGHFEGAFFEIHIVPLVSYVWIGSILMIIGGIYALIPRIRSKN